MKHKTLNLPQNYNLRSQSELAQSTASESTNPQDGATSEPQENLPQTPATQGTESVPSELYIIPEDTHQTSTVSENRRIPQTLVSHKPFQLTLCLHPHQNKTVEI